MKKIITTIMLIASVGLFATACSDDSSDDNVSEFTDGTLHEQDPKSEEGYVITYRAKTSDESTGSLIYTDTDYNIVQKEDHEMPWEIDLEPISDSIESVGMNITVQQGGSGDVTCEILWDGELIVSETNSGDYAMASCSMPLEF